MEKVSKTLTEQLARVAVGVERLTGSDSPRQIDIDLLLSELRDMYDTVYHYADASEETVDEAPATVASEPEMIEPEPAPAAPVEEEKPVVEPVAAAAPTFVAPLVFDTDEPAPYAPEESESNTEILSQQPSVEEVEGADNEAIFETPDEEPEAEMPQPVSEPEPEPVAEPQAVGDKAAQNAPQTLWEKLQATHTESPLGEQMGSGRTLSEQLGQAARGIGQGVAVESAAKVEEPEIQEPVAEPAPMPEAPAEPQQAAEPQQPKEEQPSLFDYLRSSQTHTEHKAKPVTPTTTPIGEVATAQTVADTLGANRQGGIEKTLSANKVQDLRTIININDKFSFQNELFHYNMRAYTEFIMKLNAMDDRETALDYVATVAEQNQWNNDSLTVQTFYKLFDRKF